MSESSNRDIIKAEQKRISNLIDSGTPLKDMGTYEQWLMYGTEHEKEITCHLSIISGDW
jgi:hypothetical protein